MEILAEIITGVGVAIASWVVCSPLRKFLTFPDTHYPRKDFAELQKEYAKWEGIGTVLYGVLVCISFFVVLLLLILLYEFRLSYIEESRYLIPQPPMIWVLPAILLGLFPAIIPVHYVLLFLLGSKRYEEFTEYGNQKHRFDASKATKRMIMVFVTVPVAFILFSFDSYARVTEQEFVANRFWGIGEKTYSFDDIEHLELVKSSKAPNGNIVYNKYFIIAFNDGSKYNFHWAMHDLSYEKQREIVNFLSQKTAIDIHITDPYPDSFDERIVE
jgi:hypothetical protein